jgi:hypothetical protein
MKKKEFKEQIEETKIQLKAISRDSHHCDVLIDKLLSLKGQSMIEPTMIHVPMADVIDSIEGETFTLSKTKQGVVYHQKNGFDLFIPLNGMTSGLFEQINWLIDNKDTIDNEQDQDIKDFYKYSMLDIAYTFQMLFGLWMADADFMALRSECINKYIDLVAKKLKEWEEAPLQEETHEENAEFEKTVIAIETLKEEVKREEAELND